MYQRDLRKTLPQSGDKEWEAIYNQVQLSTVFILPELFSFHDKLHRLDDYINESKRALGWLQSLSQALPNCLIIGGTIYMYREKHLHNVCPVLKGGKVVNFYSKRRLFGHEPSFLKPGQEMLRMQNEDDSWGVMICADALNPEYFAQYGESCNIAIPTASPYKEETIEIQHARDAEIFGSASKNYKQNIYKCCTVGSLHPELPDGSLTTFNHQGRSLIAVNGDIIIRAPHIHWTGFITHIEGEKHKVSLTDYE